MEKRPKKTPKAVLSGSDEDVRPGSFPDPRRPTPSTHIDPPVPDIPFPGRRPFPNSPFPRFDPIKPDGPPISDPSGPRPRVDHVQDAANSFQVTVSIFGFERSQIRTYVDMDTWTLHIQGDAGSDLRGGRPALDRRFPVPRDCLPAEMVTSFGHGTVTVTIPKRRGSYRKRLSRPNKRVDDDDLPSLGRDDLFRLDGPARPTDFRSLHR